MQFNSLLLTLIALFNFVLAAPIAPRGSGTFLAPSPRWVTYSDMGSNDGTVVPKASSLGGFNVFILAFYLSSGPTDQVQAFASLPASKRQAIIEDLHSNGISLMMSVFGSTEAPTTDGVDPWAFASKVASFVKQYGLDGVDVDYEDFKSINNGSGEAEQWLINFTSALRSHLPSGQYFITHAPVAPWFTTSKDQYPHGAYRSVAQKSGDKIDWFNIQYYNQDNMYASCSNMIISSPQPYPHTAVKEINTQSGIPLEKLVIGKPAVAIDANGGGQDFMSKSAIASCLKRAKEEIGWNAGVMFWEWPHASVSLLEGVRALSFPILGGGNDNGPKDSGESQTSTSTSSSHKHKHSSTSSSPKPTSTWNGNDDE